MMSLRPSSRKLFIAMFLIVGCYALALTIQQSSRLIEVFEYRHEGPGMEDAETKKMLAEVRKSAIRVNLTGFGTMLLATVVQFFLAWKHWRDLRRDKRTS